MGLKIPINLKKLVDSPYDESNKGFFEFTSQDTEPFLQDLINGNPTCFLISGYRGAGKTSFIKRLAKDVTRKDDKTLFVYLNFAKHEERTILLRKLIRNFYLQFEGDAQLFKKINENPAFNEPLSRFRELYERTFYAVSKNSNEKKVDVEISTLKFVAPLKHVFLIFGFAMAFFTGFGFLKWYIWIVVTILGYFTYDVLSRKEKSSTSEVSKDMLYDDEIAEYYLIETIRSFNHHLKLVFVLDELDKIHDDQLVESLINELKPIMLSGLANFIVVAGQNLFYNYYVSKTRDDGALSSLFSKIYHVPLLPAVQLRVLFNRVIVDDTYQLPESDSLLLESYIDYLIFESKRVPRRFITLVRQNIIWEGNNPVLDIVKSWEELKIYSDTLRVIETIDDREIISNDYPGSIRDYFVMQLLLEAQKILSNRHSDIYY